MCDTGLGAIRRDKRRSRAAGGRRSGPLTAASWLRLTSDNGVDRPPGGRLGGHSWTAPNRGSHAGGVPVDPGGERERREAPPESAPAAKSPCDGVRLPRIERVEMRFLEPGEVIVLADAMDPRHRELCSSPRMAACGRASCSGCGPSGSILCDGPSPSQRRWSTSVVIPIRAAEDVGRQAQRPAPPSGRRPAGRAHAHLAGRPRLHRTGGRTGAAERVAAALLGPGGA